MSWSRLKEPITWAAPRWHWIGADCLIVFAAFALPVLAAALFDPGVLSLAFGLGGTAAVGATWVMESSDPNDWDKVGDVTSRLLLPGALVVGHFGGWWLGGLWAVVCAVMFLLTLRYSRP